MKPGSSKAGSSGPVQNVYARCSFCLKPNTDVGTLVAGPGVYICDACVALCQEIIKTKPAEVPPPDYWEQAMSLDDVLASLPRMAMAGAQVEERLAHRVRTARSLGATWARIGAALDMTRQSAWERFSGEE